MSGCLAYALVQSLILPAMPTLQRELSAERTLVAWVATGFYLTASVATPIAGRLGDMFGKRRALLVSLGVFATGSLACTFATSIELLIAGRIVQGLGGAVFPLSFAIIRDAFPPERVALGIATLSGVFGLGNVIGVVLAGPIVEYLSYRYLFVLPLLLALVALAGARIAVPSSPVRTGGRVNVRSAVLLTLSLLIFLVAITQAADWGFLSGRFLVLLALAALAGFAWTRSELSSRTPLIDMRLVRARAVWLTNAAALLFGAGMFTFFMLVPDFASVPAETGIGFGASPTEASLFLMPLAVFMVAASPLSTRILPRQGPRGALVVGLALMGGSLLLLTELHSEPWHVYAVSAVFGAGSGFGVAALTNLIVQVVAVEETGVATGINTLARLVGQGIGAQLAATILALHAPPSGVPLEEGFVIGFAAGTATLFAGVAVALLIPRTGSTFHQTNGRFVVGTHASP